MHRLNRAEYANAIHDLLGLDIDATALLPADDESSGFDNIADVLRVSPSLMERYLSASWNISRLAVGNSSASSPATATYRVRPDLSQDQHIDGLPLGTRGGILVQHNFPVDGEYVIKVRLWRNTFDLMRGMEDAHQIEISLDGARVRLVTVGRQGRLRQDGRRIPATFGADLDQQLTVRMPREGGRAHRLRGHDPAEPRREGRSDQAVSAHHSRWAGHHRRPFGGPRSPLKGPSIEQARAIPPSRRKIFVCRPAKRSDELPCARKILSALARRAYRRPLKDSDLETPAQLLSAPPQQQRQFRRWNRIGAAVHSGQSRSSCSALSPIRPMSPRDADVSDGRSGAGFAPVLLLVEQHSRRPTC